MGILVLFLLWLMWRKITEIERNQFTGIIPVVREDAKAEDQSAMVLALLLPVVLALVCWGLNALHLLQ